MGHVGVRARANAARGVCDGLKLPCGAALAQWPPLDSNRMGAHTTMLAGGVLVPLSILRLLLLFTSATEGVEMFKRLGVCVSFRLPIIMREAGCSDAANSVTAPRGKLQDRVVLDGMSLALS